MYKVTSAKMIKMLQSNTFEAEQRQIDALFQFFQSYYEAAHIDLVRSAWEITPATVENQMSNYAIVVTENTTTSRWVVVFYLNYPVATCEIFLQSFTSLSRDEVALNLKLRESLLQLNLVDFAIGRLKLKGEKNIYPAVLNFTFCPYYLYGNPVIIYLALKISAAVNLCLLPSHKAFEIYLWLHSHFNGNVDDTENLLMLRYSRRSISKLFQRLDDLISSELDINISTQEPILEKDNWKYWKNISASSTMKLNIFDYDKSIFTGYKWQYSLTENH